MCIMYMQIDPIHMAYMNSVYSVVTDLCTNFMILGLMMLGVCACVCVCVFFIFCVCVCVGALHDKIANGQKTFTNSHPQFC